MPRFFVPSLEGETVSIEGNDARHIAKSLRMQPGEELVLCDGRGTDALCQLTEVSSQQAEARILNRKPSASEPQARLRLYQAWPKGDKLDFIVQKAVELGVAEVIPVMTSRCISRPDAKSAVKKREKLGLTALEAAKQSGRGIIPCVGEPQPFSSALESMKQDSLAILFYEKAEDSLRQILESFVRKKNGDSRLQFASLYDLSPIAGIFQQPDSAFWGEISIMVGSEGGFSPEEAEEARQAGLAIASLGSRILRCETAPLAALSCILYALGEV